MFGHGARCLRFLSSTAGEASYTADARPSPCRCGPPGPDLSANTSGPSLRARSARSALAAGGVGRHFLEQHFVRRRHHHHHRRRRRRRRRGVRPAAPGEVRLPPLLRAPPRASALRLPSACRPRPADPSPGAGSHWPNTPLHVHARADGSRAWVVGGTAAPSMTVG